MIDHATLEWAARVLTRRRHNFVGTWSVDPDGHVVQVYHGAIVTVLTPAQAIEQAMSYEPMLKRWKEA